MKQIFMRAAQAARPVQIIFVWAVIFVITLLVIIWRTYWLSAYVVLALSALTFLWPTVRKLRGYMLTLLALTTGFVIVSLIANNAAYVNWAKTLPLGVQILIGPQFPGLRLITVVLLALSLIGSGLKRKDLFLAKSDLTAPFQSNLFSRRPISWWLVGGLLFVIASGLTVLFMVLSTHFSPAALQRVLINLPFILLAGAFNAFVEEFGWRSVLIARLNPVLGPSQANLLQATYFGLSHYYATPGGPVGVIMTFGLGWMFGKSVQETHGSTINFVTHFMVDSIIFAFYVMAVA